MFGFLAEIWSRRMSASADSQPSPGMRRVLRKVAHELGLDEGSAELAELSDRLMDLWSTPINEDELINALLSAGRGPRQAP